MANSDSSQYVLRYNEISGDLEFAAGNVWAPIVIANAGITQLTGVVLAGPGSGSQVTTLGTVPPFTITSSSSVDSTLTLTSGSHSSVIIQTHSGNHDLVIQNDGFSAFDISSASGTIGLAALALHGNSQPIVTNAQMSAGTQSPDGSAILSGTSTTQGFLPPRMTTTEKNAIATPAEGLVVYDLTLHKLCVWTGSAWETITSI